MATENITGTAVSVTVLGTDDPKSLLADPTVTRDAVLATNRTPGTVVYCADTAAGAADGGEFPVLPGQTVSLPFRTGQIYARVYATTTEGEALGGADLWIRPVVVDSPVTRSIVTFRNALASLFTSLVSQIRGTSSSGCGGDYAFDLQMVAGCDYSLEAGNETAPTIPLGGYDVSGRTIQARTPSAAVIDWITGFEVVNPGAIELQEIRMIASPTLKSTYIVQLVAVKDSDPTDVKALVRGQIKVV